jgi:hypothetical protein
MLERARAQHSRGCQYGKLVVKKSVSQLGDARRPERSQTRKHPAAERKTRRSEMFDERARRRAPIGFGGARGLFQDAREDAKFAPNERIRRRFRRRGFGRCRASQGIHNAARIAPRRAYSSAPRLIR